MSRDGITTESARQEALRRACGLAQQDYAAFLGLMFPTWELAAHHRLIVQKLQDVADGRCKRLMFFLPPGSAKSTYANGRFIPWYLGKFADRCAILATHTSDFSAKWGRRSRAIASSPGYRSIFGFGVDKRIQAAADWVLESGSEYMAVGAGGAVTGNRADLIVLDDPVKGREDADSSTMRSKLWDWYLEDLRTRLKPGGAVVLIMTRWHEDDLAGRLLDDMQHGGEKWDVVSIPAECESADDPLGRKIGEMLWPEWFRPEEFEISKRNARVWASLYQQRPAPEEGAYFQREWPKTYDAAPRGLRIFGASDYAVSADAGDYTVHLVAGVDDDDDIYLLDMWRGQTDALEWVESWLSMLRLWQPQAWAEEAGVIVKTVAPMLAKRLQEERLYRTLRKQYPSTTDKASRARGLQARMQAGKVYFPSYAVKPWVADLMGEMLTFPQGKHDDQVDALSLLCRMLDDIAPRRGEAISRPTHTNNRYSLRRTA